MAYSTIATRTTADANSSADINQLMSNISAIVSGWVDAEETWTYASADSPTFTFTISGDKTTKYSAGMKIKLTQTTDKYFIITDVSYGAPNTTITVYGGTDYTLANAAITSPYFSINKSPFGFPMSPLKWTVEISDTTARTTATPTQNTWYNTGSITISIPIGCWLVTYFCSAGIGDSAALNPQIETTLSTANNSESDIDFTCNSFTLTPTYASSVMQRQKYLLLSSKTSYYLNHRTRDATIDNIYLRNDTNKAIIRAICAYL